MTRVDRLMKHMAEGSHIANCSQYMYRINRQTYYLGCDSDYCCEDYYTATEARAVIEDDEEWEEVYHTGSDKKRTKNE